MQDLIERMMLSAQAILTTLTAKVPPPKPVSIGIGLVFRFEEKTLQQAVVQKLARLVSALHAAEVLLEAGYTQELGALHRQIEETCEDVTFLALGSREETLPDRHREFLEAFYAEDSIDGKITGKPVAKKAEVPRRKIRAYIAENAGDGINQSLMISTSLALHNAYSGYTHGASPNLMEMWSPSSGNFCVRGMAGTSIQNGAANSMYNYYYRSYMTFCMALLPFGLSRNEEMTRLLDEFEAQRNPSK